MRPETQTEPFLELVEFAERGPLVGILVGSESDRERMEPALHELDKRGIAYEFDVLSAHRDPGRSRSTPRPPPCAGFA